MAHALISDWLGAIFALLAFLAISLLRPGGPGNPGGDKSQPSPRSLVAFDQK